MPSASPIRSSSKGKKEVVDVDELLLNTRIEEHKIEYPRQVLLVVGLVTAFLPAYMAHAFYALTWTSLLNLPVYLAVMGATGYMLSEAYAVAFECEFLKRQRHYKETKTDRDEKVLRQLRLQVALAYAIFLVNLFFVVGNTVAQGYIFMRYDARVGLIVGPTVTAAGLWFVAIKEEAARKRKIGRSD